MIWIICKLSFKRCLSTLVQPNGTRVRVSEKNGQKWNSVIGLEIHAQINSESKLFSGSSTNFAAPVNTNVSFFDASIPGTLPALNKACVEAGIKTALALNCHINEVSYFDRKHYFYADLPLGYQITQQRKPLGFLGQLPFWVLRNPFTYTKTVRITQLQLEMDSGKSLHDELNQQSLIDLNRAGVGLMEIVFEPQLFDGEEASGLLKELSSILRTLNTCSCKMEEGALRVDANVSVNKIGEPLGIRTEVKNLNSFRSVVNAIEYEVKRQIDMIDSGQLVENETRNYDVVSKKTGSLRDKEQKMDYRFIPESNLLPLRLSTFFDVPKMKENLPSLPSFKRTRLMEQFDVSLDHAILLTNEPQLHDIFTEVSKDPDVDIKYLVDFIVKNIQGFLKGGGNLVNSSLTSSHLISLVKARKEKQYSYFILDKALTYLLNHDSKTQLSLSELVQTMKWNSMDESLLNSIIDDILIVKNKEINRIIQKGKEKDMKKIYHYVNKKYSENASLDLSTLGIKLKERIQALKDSS